MDEGLSAKLRERYLEDMAGNRLDLLVIGGGITGAGIAWDASCRGMSVGLVEMNDFASGLSGRSVKLIHGGLSHLKRGAFGKVRASCEERSLLHRCAPHLVEPLPLLLPMYKQGASSYLAAKFRLYAYRRLAGSERGTTGKMCSPQEALALEKLLNPNDLKGAAHCVEYVANETRLTLEVLKTARLTGAMASKYAEVRGFIYRGGRVAGVNVNDRARGISLPVMARIVVNAAGPWADRIRQMDHPLASGMRERFTKEVWLVLDHAKLPVRQAVIVQTAGGGTVCVIPRGGNTFVGASGDVYEGSAGAPRITDDDRSYIIANLKGLFPEAVLAPADFESGWCMLNPVASAEGRTRDDMSPQHGVRISESGLITVQAGDKTGFRKNAKHVVDLAAKLLQDEDGTIYPPCTTDRMTIGGGDLNGMAAGPFQESAIRQGELLGIGADEMLGLISRYGSNAEDILRLIRSLPEQGNEPELKLLRGELTYSIRQEMALTAADFLLRRTGWVWFDRHRAERMIEPVMEVMGELLEWDETERFRQWRQLEDQLQVAWGPGWRSRLEHRHPGNLGCVPADARPQAPEQGAQPACPQAPEQGAQPARPQAPEQGAQPARPQALKQGAQPARSQAPEQGTQPARPLV